MKILFQPKYLKSCLVFIVLIFTTTLSFGQITKEQLENDYFSDTIPIIGGYGGFHFITRRDFLITNDSIYTNIPGMKVTRFEMFGVGSHAPQDMYFSRSNKFTPKMKRFVRGNAELTGVALFGIRLKDKNGKLYRPKINTIIIGFTNDTTIQNQSK